MGAADCILLTNRTEHPLADWVAPFAYRDAPERFESTRAVWLELTPEAVALPGSALRGLGEFLHAGGGLVVSGGLGSSGLTDTALGPWIPALPVCDDDALPAWRVARFAPRVRSLWPGLGHLRVERPDHPLVAETGLRDGCGVSVAYLAYLRPGADLVVRYRAMKPMSSDPIPQPIPWPFLTESPLDQGRVIYLATDAAALLSANTGFDGRRLVTNLVNRAATPPSIEERVRSALAVLESRLWRLRERVGVLGHELAGHLGEALAPPERILSDARRAAESNAHEAALAALGTARSLVAGLEAQLDEAEAEQWRRAMDAYAFLQELLAELEIRQAAPAEEIARLEVLALEAKRILAHGAVTDALNRLRGLAEALEVRLASFRASEVG